MPKYEAAVKVPGTCGELVQGTLDGVPFHVSCPIDMFSEVRVELGSSCRQWRFPPDTPRAASAVKRTLRFLSRGDLVGELLVSSSLPRSKGMASSTADVAGAIAATSLALCQELDLKTIAQLALDVEPTDGSFFPGVVVFDHREGRLYQPLGVPPPIDILVLDFGGEVDTMAFNRCDRSRILQAIEPQTTEALELVRCGIANQDPALVGKGATLSAEANQRILFKPQLEQVLSLATELGALGVNVAHSGTVIGVLLDPRNHDRSAALGLLSRNLPKLERTYLCSLISGGITRILT